jgi:hypothetical protein
MVMPRSCPTRFGSRVTHALSAVALLQGLVAFAASPSQALAADPGTALLPPRIETLDYRLQDAGNCRMLVTNWGQIGSQPGAIRPWSGLASLRWPAASETEYLWAGGLWVGAETMAAPAVSTASFAVEFAPGADPAARLYQAREGDPGGNRNPNPDADDDHDGRVDEDRLNGLDDDGDGLIDEDFAAISDQMLCGEFRDDLMSPPPAEHMPLGLRVEQSTLAWADSSIDDIVGFDYAIVNVNPASTPDLLDVYAGLFADCDIGPGGGESVSEDDRAGFWEGYVEGHLGDATRTMKVSIGYMFDGDGDNGASPGWVGLVVLGGAAAPAADPPATPVGLANFRYISGRASFAAGGDPTTDAERYAMLHGLDPRALPPPDPNTGLRPAELAPANDDYRMLASAGPLGRLASGETAHVQFAIVLGAGFDALVENAARAIMLYDNGWRVRSVVAVAVRDWEASAGSGGVHLRWRVDPEALAALDAVRVQRAPAPDGPYAEMTAVPLAPAPAMRFDDPAITPGSS